MSKKEGSVEVVKTKYFEFDELELDSGRKLSPVRIAYETYGRLNKDKTNAIEDGTYSSLVALKQKDSTICSRKVEIDYTINEKGAVYTITDEGEGFNVAEILNSDCEDLNEAMMTHGRGIIMTREIFDEINYNKKGNRVILVKHFI